MQARYSCNYESWLGRDDDAVRAELCPEGYETNDHVRGMRRGGGIALLYRDFLGVTKVDAENKKSFEFSEWLVNSSSAHQLRICVVY